MLGDRVMPKAVNQRSRDAGATLTRRFAAPTPVARGSPQSSQRIGGVGAPRGVNGASAQRHTSQPSARSTSHTTGVRQWSAARVTHCTPRGGDAPHAERRSAHTSAETVRPFFMWERVYDGAQRAV